MVAAAIVILLVLDTCATGYLVATYSKLRRDLREYRQDLFALQDYCYSETDGD